MNVKLQMNFEKKNNLQTNFRDSITITPIACTKIHYRIIQNTNFNNNSSPDKWVNSNSGLLAKERQKMWFVHENRLVSVKVK